MLLARLACVRPAASVRSEPGSNSQVDAQEQGYQTISTGILLALAFNRYPIRTDNRPDRTSRLQMRPTSQPGETPKRQNPKPAKPAASVKPLIRRRSGSRLIVGPSPPAYLFQIHNVKEQSTPKAPIRQQHQNQYRHPIQNPDQIRAPKPPPQRRPTVIDDRKSFRKA